MALRQYFVSEIGSDGEGHAVELERSSGRIEYDVFETICAFLNRFEWR